MDISDVDTLDVNEKVYRLIPSRFPTIHLYERVADADEFDILHEVESLTNPRIREEVGDIALVPKKDRVFGNGSSCIMAAFTHPPVDGRGGRFNKGFGVYYCARELDTAIAETKYHREKFFKDFNSPPTAVEMRSLIADLNQKFHTLVARETECPDIYDKDSYDAGQAFGAQLKVNDSWGVQYSSVRADGICYGVFRPPALTNCIQSKHYSYRFDGNEIIDVIEMTKVR